MTTEQATKYEQMHPDCIVIESEKIEGLQFIVKKAKKGGGMVITAGRYGSIAVRSNLLRTFVDELDEIINLYAKN